VNGGMNGIGCWHLILEDPEAEKRACNSPKFAESHVPSVVRFGCRSREKQPRSLKPANCSGVRANRSASALCFQNFDKERNFRRLAWDYAPPTAD